jgi:16S rRNA G966 N2-methylase RsmD
MIKNESEDYLKYNLISDYFMDECRMQAKRYDQQYTPLAYWEQNKQMITDKTLKEYGKVDAYTLREMVFKLAGEVTSFRPTLMVGFIKMFKAKKVLDISSGWGDRLIGAIAANITYVGVDPNTCLVKPYQEMIKQFAVNQKKYTMIHSPFETAKLPYKDFDLVLTSPPYFTLEEYSKEETQSVTNKDLNTWFDDFLIFSLNKAWDHLIVNGHMVIIINDIYKVANYTKLMVEVFNEIHDDAEYLGVISYSEFVNKKPKNPQPCWVWRKK